MIRQTSDPLDVSAVIRLVDLWILVLMICPLNVAYRPEIFLAQC